ncbi:MAG: tetratricopeptide repeat protein [Pseudomonadota bacterium]
MLEDRYGNPLTTTSTEAADAYINGVDAILSAAVDPAVDLTKSVNADSEFALARVALGRHHMLQGDMKNARDHIAVGLELAQSASPREQQHAQIFQLLSHGRGPDALRLTMQHVRDYPRDAFALAPSTSVFGLIGFSGDRAREQAQLNLLESLREAYGNDWWFLSVYAFALIEMGQSHKGRDLVVQALEQNPRSAHTAHIYAHGLYELGENQVMAEFLQAWLPDYPEHLLMSCHLWWHLCLARLALGEYERIWPDYDRYCAPGVTNSPAINVFTDGVSLLWRSELAGQPRHAERWQALLVFQQTRLPKPMVFVDAHGGLPYLALGDRSGFEGWIGALAQAELAGKLPAAGVPAQVNLAFSAFELGEWSRALEILESIRDEVVRIGGSRAQRDLVRNTLITAYLRAGQFDKARQAAAEPDRNVEPPSNQSV